MGEIGFPRHEFLYDIRWWEVRCIIDGYNRRKRDMWSAVRWQTYNLMCVSMADLKKAGINSPTDLIKFPWDKNDDIESSSGGIISEEEIQRLRNLMMEENSKAGQQ